MAVMSDEIKSINIPNVEGLNNTINLYRITGETFDALSDLLWQNEPNFWESLTGITENAINCIISCHAIPEHAEGYGSPGIGISIGNKVLSGATGSRKIKRYTNIPAVNQIAIAPYFDTALDYDPYTRVTVYLPYSGFHNLKATDVIGKKIGFAYAIDFLTGDIVWTIESTDDDTTINRYAFTGNCKLDIPLTGANYSRGITSLLSFSNQATGALVSGSPLAIAGLTQSAYSTFNNLSTPEVTLPSISGNAGWLGCQTPYIIIDRPIPHVAEKYGHYIGYPSYIYTSALSSLSGFTVMENVHLDGIKATNEELKEIESALKTGVVI